MRIISFLFLYFLLFGIGFSQDASSSKKKEKEFSHFAENMTFDLGMMIWDGELPKDLSYSPWKSKTFEIYFMGRTDIKEKIKFNVGLGVSLGRIGMKGDYTIGVKENSIPTVEALTEKGYKRNKFFFSYLEVPFGFDFYPKEGSKFFVGIGGFVGFRIKSGLKHKYKKDGEMVKLNQIKSYALRDFRYGYVFRVGFESISFFFKGYLSEMFENNFSGTEINPQLMQVGISLRGF